MENVIQKYLRNEFEIDRGVQRAGRRGGRAVPRPGVANFPANFTEEAARRLVSIATSGARCGVYTLISVDTTPAAAARLRAGRPGSSDRKPRRGETAASFGSTEISTSSRWCSMRRRRRTSCTRIVREVGRRAQRRQPRRSAVRVHRARAERKRGPTTAASGVDVPLGRAGATKLQHLRLGKGTSQHVLIAGKTGSGKSTLLHALITNSAPLLQPRRGRAVPDRLQEGRRVQDLRHARSCRTPASSPSRASASSA